MGSKTFPVFNINLVNRCLLAHQIKINEMNQMERITYTHTTECMLYQNNVECVWLCMCYAFGTSIKYREYVDNNASSETKVFVEFRDEYDERLMIRAFFFCSFRQREHIYFMHVRSILSALWLKIPYMKINIFFPGGSIFKREIFRNWKKNCCLASSLWSKQWNDTNEHCIGNSPEKIP